jgi:hypothetical protein
MAKTAMMVTMNVHNFINTHKIRSSFGNSAVEGQSNGGCNRLFRTALCWIIPQAPKQVSARSELTASLLSNRRIQGTSF